MVEHTTLNNWELNKEVNKLREKIDNLPVMDLDGYRHIQDMVSDHEKYLEADAAELNDLTCRVNELAALVAGMQEAINNIRAKQEEIDSNDTWYVISRNSDWTGKPDWRPQHYFHGPFTTEAAAINSGHEGTVVKIDG